MLKKLLDLFFASLLLGGYSLILAYLLEDVLKSYVKVIYNILSVMFTITMCLGTVYLVLQEIRKCKWNRVSAWSCKYTRVCGELTVIFLWVNVVLVAILLNFARIADAENGDAIQICLTFGFLFLVTVIYPFFRPSKRYIYYFRQGDDIYYIYQVTDNKQMRCGKYLIENENDNSWKYFKAEDIMNGYEIRRICIDGLEKGVDVKAMELK